MTLRIIATADNHLGRYSARMPVRTLDERRRRIRRAFGQAVDRAIESRAHLLLLAGDLFDAPNPRNPERVYLARRLHELNQAGVRVVAIGGNHDAPRSSTEEGGFLPLAVYHELEALCFFDQLSEARTIEPVVFDCEGCKVAVGGFTPNSNLPSDADPLEGVRLAQTDADFSILLVHAGIEGMMYPGEALIKRATLESLSEVDLLVAGNVHCFDSFTVGELQVVVPGATEWMDFGEARSVNPGFVEIEARGRGNVSVQHVAIASQPRAEIFIKTSELDVDDPVSSVIDHLETKANHDALARLVIEGTMSRDSYAKLNLQVIEERARDLFFFFEYDLSNLRVQFEQGKARASITRRSMRDEIDDVVASFIAEAGDPGEREALELTRQALQAELQQLEP